MRLKNLWGGVLAWVCMVAYAADTPRPATPNNPPVQKRDPFTTSDKMFAEQGIQTSMKSNPNGFIPGLSQGLPKMKLKGFVTKAGQRGATALLDIEGAGVYMVSKDDEIGLHALGLNNVLKIIEVNANGVKVQSGQMNQVILVR